MVRLLAIIFATTMVLSIASADDKPNDPASSWEQHPEGIALTVTLTSIAEKSPPKNSIQIYIKNTSESAKTLYGHGTGEVRIFYTDDHNAQIPLRAYNGDLLSPKGNTVLQMGATLGKTISLAPSELALIKTHPVKCAFGIYDETLKKGYIIESSPRILVNEP